MWIQHWSRNLYAIWRDGPETYWGFDRTSDGFTPGVIYWYIGTGIAETSNGRYHLHMPQWQLSGSLWGRTPANESKAWKEIMTDPVTFMVKQALCGT